MDIPEGQLLHIFRLMVQMREFEETVESMNKQKCSLGSIYTSIGEESTAVGVGTALHEDVFYPDCPSIVRALREMVAGKKRSINMIEQVVH